MVNNNEFNQIVAETSPDVDGWIEWSGGDCPVEVGALIDVKFRDGTMQPACYARGEKSPSHKYWANVWSHSNHYADITAYRLHKSEQSTIETRLADAASIVKAAAPALMSEEMKFTGDEVIGERKPTLDQLLQDWRNADDFAKRKQAEADEAASMRDERWNAVQARAGELSVTVGRCKSVVGKEVEVKKFTGKFHSAIHGDKPSDLDMICDGCGKRFGTHVGFDCRP